MRIFSGPLVWQRRLDVGLSRAEFARRMGVSAATVYMWESGTTIPTTDKLPRYAVVLGCSIDELFADDEPEPVATHEGGR